MKPQVAKIPPIALEKAIWYWKDKAVSLTVWIIGTVGGLLFLLPALTDGEQIRSGVVVLLLAGAGVFFCGILGLLSFVSRHRLAVLQDGLVVPWQVPFISPEVPFSEMREVHIARDSAGWVLAWETKSGRKTSLRLSGLDNPQRAIEVLSRVSMSI